MTITGIFRYPVKSCAGGSLDQAHLDHRGIPGDREFVVVDKDGKFLTQRSAPMLARIRATVASDENGNGLLLSAPCLPSLRWHSWQQQVPIKRQKVSIFMDSCVGRDCGDEVANWLSRFLGMPVRLIWRDPVARRETPREHAELRAPLAFQDGYPLLIASEASLAEFNERAGLAGTHLEKTMRHFRPNIVVSGCPPFDEDFFCELQVRTPGLSRPVLIRGVKRCSRCTVPDVNPDTGEFQGTDTIALLRKVHAMPVFPDDPEADAHTKKIRQVNRKQPVFGMNCHLMAGVGGRVIGVGAEIEVLSRYKA
jgi:uncharacterized protein YcbX